jgi:hypothetical protein
MFELKKKMMWGDNNKRKCQEEQDEGNRNTEQKTTMPFSAKSSTINTGSV